MAYPFPRRELLRGSLYLAAERSRKSPRSGPDTFAQPADFAGVARKPRHHVGNGDRAGAGLLHTGYWPRARYCASSKDVGDAVIKARWPPPLSQSGRASRFRDRLATHVRDNGVDLVAGAETPRPAGRRGCSRGQLRLFSSPRRSRANIASRVQATRSTCVVGRIGLWGQTSQCRAPCLAHVAELLKRGAISSSTRNTDS